MSRILSQPNHRRKYPGARSIISGPMLPVGFGDPILVLPSARPIFYSAR